jgi:hypothetical protein
MNRLEFNKIVVNRINLINQVLASKGKEYAGDLDVFHNFKSATGLSFHSSPEKVAWEFAVKHFQSIKDLLEHVDVDGANGFPTIPYIEEKIGDAINYLILIEGMLKERVIHYEDDKLLNK